MGALSGCAWLAPKTFPVEGSHSTTDWLDAYARASGLRPLTGGEAPTLRVWVEDVMLGDSSGYVVTPTATLVCRTSYINRMTSFSIRLARCSSKRPSNQQARALSLLPELARMNGSDLDCGVMDGSEVYLEGVVSGRRFSLAAGNPSLCNDAGSALVTKVLQLL